MSAKKILVVEDEPAIREMIAFHLSRAGYETLEAADCREAREQLADHRPDLALVDWMLPDSSGLELTRMLKRDPNYEDLAIIMLTARADERDKVSGLEGGADDYITKPFSPRELIARIQAVLRRAGTPDDEVVSAGVLQLDAADITPENNFTTDLGAESVQSIELVAMFEIVDRDGSRHRGACRAGQVSRPLERSILAIPLQEWQQPGLKPPIREFRPSPTGAEGGPGLSTRFHPAGLSPRPRRGRPAL